MKRIIFLLPLLLAACGDDEIRVYKIARSGEDAPAPTRFAGPPEMPRTAPSAPAGAVPAAPAAAPGALRWTVPKGWTELPASGMRRATLRAPAGAEMSIIALAGPAGGALSNVNRWRGQIGLGPIDDKTLAADAVSVDSQAGTVTVIDYAKDDTRLLAALLPHGGQTWFFKITGELAPVAAAKDDFLKFLGGLRG